jgi:drug/metabolite transporter (DMT)-like permease
VKTGLRTALSAWIEAGRKIGFLLLLVAGSAGLGFLIAWPLWFFATTARSAYTIAVLAAGGAGIVLLAVRAALRRRKSVRDPGKPTHSVLSVLLAVMMGIVGFAGVYLAAALFIRRLWIIGAADIAVWVGLLWLMARARGAVMSRKVRPFPAENGSE